VLPSLRMGRYVVEGLLGPGGVTETYLARLPDDSGEAAGQLFALKLLRRDRVPEAAYARVAQGFIAAGQRLRDWQRPGFGKVVDVSGDVESTFIVTEYVPGHDLTRLLEMSRAEGQGRAGMDPELAGLVGAEIARLLQVGHAAQPRLVHLGLSPQNVVVTDAGEVVLLDAGIAAAIRPLTEQPAERWWFVAPELAGAVALDEREGVAADLYSLGALLHFLIAGQPPGQPGEPLPPPELVGASAKVNAVLRALLAPRLEDRPASAAGVVDRLSRGANSVRRRQRLIAEGLRQAEKEAREALARARETGEAPAISLPSPADSMVADAMARAVPGLGRRRERWRVRLASLFAVAGVAAALVSFALSSGLRLGLAPRRPSEPPAGNSRLATVPASRDPGTAEGDPVAPTRAEVLAHLAGHLVAETVPPGARVWVDGVAVGTTFADIEVGPGRHRVVLTLPGHRTFREVMDTGRGAIVRRNLAPVPPSLRGTGFVRVECQTQGKFPILIDDEETGFVCPSLRVPAAVGKHTVGIYLPATGRVVSVETTVEPGARPATARFSE
jgi:hypothetical protein